MSKILGSAILSVERLTSIPWKTFDPFLFCAFHKDDYSKSAGTDNTYASMGVDPKALRGRDIGSDFSGKDGWSMYHGEVVPGFPMHPHYGFETITIVNQGLVDHSDSWGATARYGQGDVQWLTTGNGICHSEMFPLVNSDKDNHAELFQLWLNLPRAKKNSPACFSMAWADEQPKKAFGEPGKQAHVRLVGGEFLGMHSVPPPPDSYASDPKSELIVATMKMDPGSSLTLPKASSSEINRALYFYRGAKLTVDGKAFDAPKVMFKLAADRDVDIQANDTECELLYLQARPLNEPVVQHGPFVTNSREELMQVMQNYQRTHFGQWQWGRHDPVHPRDQGRFYTIKGKTVIAKPLNVEEKTEL